MRNVLLATIKASLVITLFAGAICAFAQEPLQQDDFFPIVFYSYRGPDTLDTPAWLKLIDDIHEHGWNTVNVFGGGKQAKAIQAHAQEKGMAISAFCYSLHPYRSGQVPKVCVHSPDYEADLHKFIEPRRAEYESLPRFWVGTVIDEPYVDNRLSHLDPAHGHICFPCHCEHCQREFKARYGVELPDQMPPIAQPALRRQYVEFYDDYWAKVWKLSCQYMKENNPNVLIANTYTEANCLGRHVDYAFSDLLKWAEPLDWLAADIYPYYAGRHENDVEAIEWDMKRSRLLMAFLRCAGQHYEIPFAWWVGCTSSPEETPKAIRHMSYTAIGQGAQGLIGWGAYTPQRPMWEYNPQLWEDGGRTFRDIAKIGSLLRHLQKTSRIALLASETEGLFATSQQYVGPFYYDLCPAYDALLKAFGNADLIYERQIAAGKLRRYDALVMANVRHVSDAASKGIEEFVEGGGVLMSDTVPELNENNQPSDILTKVIGRSESSARPRRLSHGAPDTFPAVFMSDYGRGKVLLLAFRIGSFYKVPALWELLRSSLEDVGVHPLAASSNPDIESNYLAGENCFVIVPVNRTRQDRTATIFCYKPPFAPKRVEDLITGKKLAFTWGKQDGQRVLTIPVSVPGLSGSAIGVYP
jgi:hypothetical protein